MRLIPPTVFEVSDPPQGLTEIKVKDSRGTRIGFFQIAASEVDAELVAALTDWQQRHCREGGSLSIMRPSASAL